MACFCWLRSCENEICVMTVTTSLVRSAVLLKRVIFTGILEASFSAKMPRFDVE